MSKLTKLLEYANASSYDKKKILNSQSFIREFGKEKALLLSEEGEGTTKKLVETELLNVIQAGAKQQELVRNRLSVVEVKDNYKAKIAYGTNPYEYASYVAEGSNIPIDNDDYDSTDISINKTAERPRITSEMVEDCQYGIIELELMRAGAKIENKLNQESLDRMLDDHGGTPSDIDPLGTHLNISDITSAYGNLADRGWNPKQVFFHPSVIKWLGEDFEYIQYFEDLTDGNADLYNAETSIDATSSWTQTDGANNYNAIILDPNRYVTIAMRQDIELGEYKDPVHDLTDAVATMRFGVGILNDDAAIKILSK